MSESTPDTQTQNTEADRAPTQQQSGEGPEVGEVTDEMLPEDLRPNDDNPLAKAPGDDDEEAGLSLGPDGPQS